MKPVLNEGAYIFCVTNDLQKIDQNNLVSFFREQEGYSVILRQEEADRLQIPYSFVAAWITLMVHSSLEAVGLTAAFSKALSDQGISCNVVAGFYHDHLFVALQDAAKAMAVLNALSDQ